MNIASNTPILVGVAQQTYRDQDNLERTPVSMLTEISELALADSGRADKLRGALDAVVTEPSLLEVSPELGAMLPQFPGPELAARLGLAGAACYKAPEGGNGPQFLINHFADAVHRGEHRAVLITGGELTASFRTLLGGGQNIAHWAAARDGDTRQPWTNREGASEAERAHNLWLPVNMYPLFENALRHHHRRGVDEHQQRLGRLMQRLSDVAAANPHAWSYQRPRSAEQIASAATLAFPYSKYMCAQMNVDMGAAVILTTVGQAIALGIDRERWVFLNGCADINDIWHVSERPDFHSARAVAVAGQAALQRAGRHIHDIELLDIYSCFPCAVDLACEALDIDPFGARELTVTGGLPYFGGPGHSYSLHAVASMVERLRDQPGSHGLVSANGWYMTKQSIGVYSTEAAAAEWQRGDDSALQAQTDNAQHPQLDTAPEGGATVETYTVVCGQNGPEQGVVIGRLDSGRRFIAHTADDATTLKDMMRENVIGRRGRVSAGEPVNRFEFS